MNRGSSFTVFCLVAVLPVFAASLRASQGGAKEETIKLSQLPAPVAEALKNNCANCAVAKATREVENGVTIYDFEFKAGRGEMDVAEDGLVISREIVVKTTDVPAAALKAIRTGAAGGKIKQIVREEVRADLVDGKVIKLDAPKYFYEADLAKRSQVAEIRVTPAGEVSEAPKWVAKGSKEN